MNEIIKDLLKDVPRHLKRHVLREFLQLHTLYRVSKSPFASKLVFMGGTALRIFYDAQRYSEDLDFDLRSGVKSDFNFIKLTESIGRYFNRQNCGCDIKTGKSKSIYRGFVRFKGLLFGHQLSPHQEEILSLKLEVDLQPNPHSQVITSVVNKYNLIFPLLCRDLPSLMAGKICAVFKRGYPLGRDFFDLAWFLSKKIAPNFAYLKSEVGIDKRRELVDRLSVKIQRVDLKRLTDQIHPFLIRPEESVLLSHFKEILRDYAE